MDSIQTWYEASLVCVHSFLWIWANSETSKKYHPSLLLSVLFSTKKCNFWSLITSMNIHGFQPNSNRVTPTMSSNYPVNMSKIWWVKKYHLLWCFHWQVTQRCTFWSFITIMNGHGFQPNSNRVTPTMSPSYPVNMSKIWCIKKYHLLWCFHWQVTQKCNLWVTYKFHECPWISTKFDVKQSHCTLIHPCEYE